MNIIDAQITQILFNIGGYIPSWISVFLASYLIWILLALSILFLMRRSKRLARSLITLIAAPSLAYVVDSVIGYLFFRPRPFDAIGISALINTLHLDKSFPSDHTAVAWSIALVVFFEDKKSGALLLALALLVSLGRIFVGVHYLGDILGGIIVGVISAVVMRMLVIKSRTT